jgi:threonine-phosphate decarboxylase
MMIQHGGDLYAYPHDLLDFSVNVNPLGLPPAIREAAKQAIDHCAQYPDPQCRALRAALSEYEQVPPSQIVFGNGAADLIFRLVQILRPKRALLTVPSFSEYEQALNAADCALSYHKLQPEDQYELNDRILLQLTEQVDLCFLCNPNNPTGRLIKKDVIRRIAAQCCQNHITLVLDECFIDFLEHSEAASMKSELNEYPNLILLKAFTKTYAMAGLRLGYALCADEALIRRLHESAQPWSVSIPAQEAALAALTQTDYLEEARSIIQTERPYLEQALTEFGFSVVPSQANFILFRTDDTALMEKLLHQNILIRSCANFRGLDHHHYRIAVKTHAENEQLIHAIAQCREG